MRHGSSLAHALAFTALALASGGAPSAAAAAVPGQVSFQGLLLDSGGAPLNGSVDLVFRLFDSSSGGTELWTESHAGTSVLDGVYDVTLGATTPLTQTLLSGGSLWLEIEADGEALTPRERLLAVPYALRAAEAESVGGLSSTFVSQIFQHFNWDGGSGPPADDPREGLDDLDGDGISNFIDIDNDGDGVSDGTELQQGSDMNLPTPRITGFDPAEADFFVTTTVEVEGDGFEPGLSVVFGSQTPTPVDVTPTSFQVDVGSQAVGSVGVVVTNTNGETGSSSFPFVEFEPVIYSFDPPSADGSISQTVTVTGSDFDPGMTVAFGSQNPAPTNVTPTSFDVLVGPQTSGSVSVVVTHPNGNSDTASYLFFDGASSTRVFLTNAQITGNMGGLAGADAFCNARAAAAGRTETFKAWLSDGIDSPASRFDAGAIDYLRYDDFVVAFDFSDLTDGTLEAPIDVGPAGNPVGVQIDAWTNVDTAGGTAGANHCSGWTSTSGSGAVGQPAATDSNWTAHDTASCSFPRRLYCFED